MDKNLFIARYKELKERIEKACISCGRNSSNVRVIVVTKTHSFNVLQDVIDCGITDIGENRVQEIEQKIPLLNGDFNAHLIGHLQTNKVNKVVPLVHWIQSVDSMRLAEKINAAAVLYHKTIKVLVQVNTSNEESKSGCNAADAQNIAAYVSGLPALLFSGFMTIGPLGNSETETRKSFKLLRDISLTCSTYCRNIELSMGMSLDFEWAIQEGATMIRVGSLLLGDRI
jgi:pyridoxal phosphate enzyme (YggS family)